jgi:hypothetical protein
MRKKIIILLVFLTLLIGGLLLLTYNHHILLWNINAIRVSADEPLKRDKVKIEYGMSANSYNRSDTGSILKREKYSILAFEGGFKNKIPNEYGENDFLITYDEKYYLTFRHFKTNWKHQHDYNFYFYPKDNQIFIHADIKGVDDKTFDRPMLKLNSQ